MLDVSSHFLYHAPCPKCNSKDNLGVYSTGSAFCFGCGYFTILPITKGPPNPIKNLAQTVSKPPATTNIRSYPNDINTNFPQQVIKWINKYHLTPVELIKNNVFWSPSREQLIYTFYGECKDVVLWQARNFRQGTTHKHRFFTGGSPEAVIAKYNQGESRDTCIVVEDCLSGIKVSYAGYEGVPCFRSNVSKEKLTRLSRLYKKMYVWLDSDKYNNSQALARQGAMVGMTTKAIYTALDPKEYSIEEIKEIIG